MGVALGVPTRPPPPTPTQPTLAPMPEPCAAPTWGNPQPGQPGPPAPAPQPAGPPSAMGPGPMPGIRTFQTASTWSSDNFSTAGHAGQRVDLESSDGEGGRTMTCWDVNGEQRKMGG